MRSGQIWFEIFTIFNQIRKYFSVKRGKLRDIDPSLCSMVFQNFYLLHTNGFCSLVLFISLFSVLRIRVYIPNFLTVEIFGTEILEAFCLAFLWGQILFPLTTDRWVEWRGWYFFGICLALMVGLPPLVDRWIFAGMACSGQIGFLLVVVLWAGVLVSVWDLG